MNKKLKSISHWIARFLKPPFLRKAFSSFTLSERRAFFITLGILLLSVATLLAQAYYKNTAYVAVAGGEYIEGSVGQPIVINPILNQNNGIDRDLAELIFSGLFKSNGRGGTRLDLAENYKVSEDGLVWTIFLKDNVFWHDGEKFDADDVVFTIEAVQDPETGSHLFNSWQGVVVERVSSLEVKVYLRSPYAAFSENLKELKIIPSHIFGAIPRANFRLSAYNLEPIGTGPFMIMSSEAIKKRKDGFITSYTLSRNEKYYRGPVFIDTIKLQFYQNEEELIKAFNNREIDGFGNAKPSNIKKIQLPSRSFSFRLPRYFAIFLNQKLREELTDGDVREALNLATDKNSILKFVFDDHGEVANGPIVRGMLGYKESFGQFVFQPEIAKRILDENGWEFAPPPIDEENPETAEPNDTPTPTTAEYVRRKDGSNLEFELVVPETDQLIEVAQLLKQTWEDIGFKINIVQSPLSEITSDYIRGRTYEMLMFGNIVSFDTDLFAFWHSSQKFHPGLNLALLEDNEVDTLIESARQSLDEESRIEDLRAIQDIVQYEIPAIFLFSPDYLYVTNNKLKGLETLLILTPSERFSRVDRWSIKQARVFE